MPESLRGPVADCRAGRDAGEIIHNEAAAQVQPPLSVHCDQQLILILQGPIASKISAAAPEILRHLHNLYTPVPAAFANPPPTPVFVPYSCRTVLME